MSRATPTRPYGGVSASQRRRERRGKLLASGRLLWGNGGLAEVTVRGVCAAAGLGPRYFYEEFADRDSLVLAVADQVRDELLAALVTSGLGDPGDVSGKLFAGLKAFLDLINADPNVQRIVTDVLTAGGKLAERRRQALDTITDLVLLHGPSLLDVELPTPAEMRRIATFIVGGANQLIDSWVRDPQQSPAELARTCTELALAVINPLARVSP